MRIAIFCLSFAILTGCTTYTTPGPGAPMSRFGVVTDAEREKMTDHDIRRQLELKPLAQFPANVAMARVQGSGYRSYGSTIYGRGGYTFIPTRDAATDEHLEQLTGLPMLAQVGYINRLLLPEDLRSDRELREGAAKMRADILLVYTFDTDIYLGSDATPVDVVTLGFLPHKKARVTSTASAALLDVRNGYLYGVADGVGQREIRANTWNDENAIDASRREAEAEAFDTLVENLGEAWRGIVAQYAAAEPVAESGR